MVNGFWMKVAAGVGVALICTIASLVVTSWSGHASEDVVSKHIVKNEKAHEKLEADDEKLRDAVASINTTVASIDAKLEMLVKGYEGGN